MHKFDQAVKDPRLHFFGNVQGGPQSAPAIPHALLISLSSLQPHYTPPLFSTGCAILPYPPCTPRCHPPTASSPRSRSFTAIRVTHHCITTNTAPRDRVRLDHQPGQRRAGRHAHAAHTSRSARKVRHPESVLEILRSSAVRHVSILGRRGPLQAAFTNKELRERTSLTRPCVLSHRSSLLTRQT